MSSTLFCGNVSFSTTQAELKAHCDAIGVKGLTQVELVERNGRSRGWALLHFGSEELARAAQQKLNNSTVADRTLNVRENRESGGERPPRPANSSYNNNSSNNYNNNNNNNNSGNNFTPAPRPARVRVTPSNDEPETPCNRLFVGNLPWDITSTQLRDLFTRFNPESTDIQKRLSGRSKGFGTVVFRTEAEATAAKTALNNSLVDGRTISVRYDKEGSVQPTARLFVGNLPWSAGDNELRAMFEGFALVSASVKVVNGRSRGFGIVEFKTVEDAKKAHLAKAEFTHEDRTIFTRFDRQE